MQEANYQVRRGSLWEFFIHQVLHGIKSELLRPLKGFLETLDCLSHYKGGRDGLFLFFRYIQNMVVSAMTSVKIVTSTFLLRLRTEQFCF